MNRQSIIWELHQLGEHLAQVKAEKERLAIEETRVLRHMAILRQELRENED